MKTMSKERGYNPEEIAAMEESRIDDPEDARWVADKVNQIRDLAETEKQRYKDEGIEPEKDWDAILERKEREYTTSLELSKLDSHDWFEIKCEERDLQNKGRDQELGDEEKNRLSVISWAEKRRKELADEG